MKHNVNQLPEPEPGQGVMSTYIEGQATPFLVHGDAAVIEGLYAAVKDKSYNVPVVHEKPATRPVRAPQSQVEVLTGRKAALRAKLYDIANGTNMYEALLQKRQDERDVAMATRLGLLSIEDVSCRKHEHAIKKLHNL